MMPATLTSAPLERARMSVGVSENAKSTAPAAYEDTVVADPSPLTIVTSKPASFQKPLSRATKNGACLPYGVKSNRKVIFSGGRPVCTCARRVGARLLLEMVGEDDPGFAPPVTTGDVAISCADVAATKCPIPTVAMRGMAAMTENFRRTLRRYLILHLPD